MKTEIDIQAIIDAGHDEDYAGYIRALCAHLECEPDDLKEESWDTYGLTTFEYGSQSYAVGTDEEANFAACKYVEDSAWAFNSEFICDQCDLPSELAEVLQGFQSDRCEGANDAILALIEKCTTVEKFTEAACSADGRGHLLGRYDDEENEETAEDASGESQMFYIYRVN
jgi:hypothetical protein